ncbi:GGDEF domain-containing protein [Niveibacterium terrae]|uniref:GGDEF domain-containing protein n=1 Tax=Niveibacterium terrae TaxID=3373598 RepID=UPI003A908B0A
MDSNPSSPSEIARDVLRRLATNRIPPTPDNFRRLYFQIAGSTPDDDFPEREFRSFAASLPRVSSEQLRIARRVEGAIADSSWPTFHERMLQLLQECAEASPPWAALLQDLVTQLERHHANFSPARKREALEHVLSSSQADAQQLFNRLQALIGGWTADTDAETISLVEGQPESAASPATQASPLLAPNAPPASPLRPAVSGAEALNPLRPILADLLQEAIGTLLVDTPALVEEAARFAAALRNTAEALDAEALAHELELFADRVRWVVNDQSGIRSALLNLLRLIVENINELLLDDSWMQGQLSGVLEITQQPLGRDSLDELSRRLRGVIAKQGTLKRSIAEAQSRLKDMLSGFVDHLSDFYDSTGEYRTRVEHHAEQVARANSISELSEVIGDLIGETRAIQDRAERSRGEIQDMKGRVDAANAEIARLQQELEETSQLVRHDPLTGALNRKGLDEALEREVGRGQRSGKPLCVALLDVDNFKQLNDTLGHSAGDSALLHLSRVIQDTLRPQDAVARYGGEEFVLLLPGTEVDAALGVVQRLQRELTRRFFLHENSKVLITFSAGVSQIAADEAPQKAVERADAAMYRAKRAGKNRVEAG